MKEKWDLFNKNGKLLKQDCYRGDYLKNNQYHKVVNVWIKDKNNNLIISQRIKTKPHGLMWEETEGSVLKGESTYEACLREAKEELNIDLTNKNYKLIGKQNRYYDGGRDIVYVYLFEVDEFKDIKMQEEEVVDYKIATINDIKKIQAQDKFLIHPYYEKVIYLVSLMK